MNEMVKLIHHLKATLLNLYAASTTPAGRGNFFYGFLASVYKFELEFYCTESALSSKESHILWVWQSLSSSQKLLVISSSFK